MQYYFNVDLMLPHITASYQLNDDVETMLKCLLGLFSIIKDQNKFWNDVSISECGEFSFDSIENK